MTSELTFGNRDATAKEIAEVLEDVRSKDRLVRVALLILFIPPAFLAGVMVGLLVG